MTHHVGGTFAVELTPHPLADPEADGKIGRLAIVKQVDGVIVGTSRGEGDRGAHYRCGYNSSRGSGLLLA